MNRILTVIRASVLVLVAITTANAQANTVKTDDALNTKQAGIVPIAAFTASGDLSRLKTALNEGLDAGLTINEINEVLVQMYAYAGFPRSLNGINTFMDVLDQRKHQGEKDVPGQEAHPLPADKSSLELGSKIRTQLTGNKSPAGYALFLPHHR